MANNKRVFWAVQGVVIGEMGESTVNTTWPYNDKSKLNPVKGLQSVGITTTFNLEQVFEMGQLALYENLEEVPDVEVTLEKVLDGYPLLYHLATSNPSIGAVDTLVGRSTERCDLRMGVYSDTASKAGAVAPQSEVYCSGMYVSSISYTIPVDGNATESCTLVGNHKQWYSAATAVLASPAVDLGFGSESAPSGTTRRQHINLTASKLPTDIPGIGSDGQMDSYDGDIQNKPSAHIQSLTVSADLGRESISELGHKDPYHRFVSWPVEVTCEIEVVTGSGDFVDAQPNATNLSDQTIRINLSGVASAGGGAGLVLDLGAKNKLTSVSYSGADTGGGNATTSFSYSTFNDLTVFHIRNPTN
jgi:hypothetical protein